MAENNMYFQYGLFSEGTPVRFSDGIDYAPNQRLMTQTEKSQIITDEFSSASRRIRAQKNEIIQLWSKQVREAIPSARNEDNIKLHNGLPEFIDTLATYIPSTPGTEEGQYLATEIIDLCKQHGQQRALSTGYTLDEVIFEYRILRYIILKAIDLSNSMLSHDLKTPLSAAKTGAELIVKADIDSSKLPNLARLILGNIDRMDIFPFTMKAKSSVQKSKSRYLHHSKEANPHI
ncbi:MAG: RsbRD N-terminal domain-containing protein [Bdellovibrionia bacterium]